VVADGIDQGAETLGIPYAPGTSYQLQTAGEGFLLDVLYGLAGSEPGAQLQGDQLAEVCDEVAFRVPVTRTEPFDISVIKRLEVQVDPSLAGVQWCKCIPAIQCRTTEQA
jgi:hypothetical protein